MLAAITGQRMLFNYFRIGGVNGDLNHEFMSRLGDWMSRAAAQLEANTGSSTRTRSSSAGCATSAGWTARPRCGWRVTGPNLRAAGVPFDVRRAHPYSVYPELEFDIPVRGIGPGGGDSPRPLPAPARRGQAEHADHRPVPPQHARRAGHGPAAAPAPAAPGPGVGGRRGPARAVRDVRHLGRHGPAVPA